MKKSSPLQTCFPAVFLALLCPLAALAKNNPPHYPVQPVGTAPVIDGKLDDACWKQLPAVGSFVTTQAKAAPAQTTVQIGYDDKNLYIAARMEEPEMDKVLAAVTQHDGGVWQDDDLEIFLAPTGQATPYLVFSLNSIGTTEEGSMDAPSTSFNVPWQCKVNREAGAWTAEIAIPFSSLSVQKPKPGALWYGNIGRNRAHAKEISTWSTVPGGFHDTNAFGEFCFLDKVVLNEVQVTPKPIEGGVKLRVEARGEPVTYNTRLFATVDGVGQPGTPDLYNGFAVTPAQLTGCDHTYLRPEAARITLQPELINSTSHQLVFRGESMVVKEVDELPALVASTAKLLIDFPPDQAPASLHDLAATWPQRLADLQKKPDLIPAKKLRQEIRAAQWDRCLPAPAADQPVLLFPTNPFVDIDYDFLPEPATVGSTVTLQAMRGEYAPACVNVLALSSDQNALVTVDDLKGPDGAVLPASAFEPRVLKAWYRNGHGGFQDPGGEGVWTNELLLKDDAIISCDPVAKRNTIHSTKDAATLQPVQIDRFLSRQFWLTLHVPDRQAAGLYSGQIRATAGGKEVGSIPFQVRVLPLTLEKGKFSYTMYYLSRIGISEKEDRWYEADLKSMAEHGFTSASMVEWGENKRMTDDGTVQEFDFSKIRKAMELRKKYGLAGKTIYRSGPRAHGKGAAHGFLHQTPEQRLASPIFQHNWKLYARTFTALYKEMGFEKSYYYGIDEPGYDPTGMLMKLETMLGTWAKESGVNLASAITVSAAESIKDILALPILDTQEAVIGPDRRKLPFDEAWVYWHPMRSTTYDRLMSGVMIWYGGYTGADPWVYKWDVAEWNDWFKSRLGYSLENYVFPGEDGPVPTREYEGFREGIDDAKYLEMLDRRVQALASHQKKLDAATRDAWKQAEHLVNHAPAQIQGKPDALNPYADGKVLGDFRLQVADLLVKLDPPARAHGMKP